MERYTKSKVKWFILVVIILVVISSLFDQYNKSRYKNSYNHHLYNADYTNTVEINIKNSNSNDTINPENTNILEDTINPENSHIPADSEIIVKVHEPDSDPSNSVWRCENNDFIGKGAITSVALLKVHKTGSTTLSSILYRFGIRRGLSFIMVNNPTHQYWPYTIDKSYKGFYPPCSQDKYDVLNIHSRYNGRSILTKYMQENTYVIATIRHPMNQMLSGLYYYGYVDQLNSLGKTISDFLDTPSLLGHRDGLVRQLTWNSMSYDIGLSEFNIPIGLKKSQLENDPKYMAEIERFLIWAEENIDFFVISEKFDESLILLKDRLGWRIEDLIYFTLNAAASPSSKRSDVDTDVLLIKTNEFSYIDYLLYDRMKLKLDKMIQEKGAALEREVAKLRSLNKEFSEYCLEKVEVDPHLYGAVKILSNRLRKEGTVTNKCCFETALDEMEFVSEIKKYMGNSCNYT